MKKQITGVAVALLTSAIFTVSASADYYINTQQDGNTVKAEVIADSAALPAIEFTVKLPDDIEIEDFYTISGSVFNESNGHFAWADVKAPDNGTVMYSVTFTVKNGDKGKLVITPAEGYEDDMPENLIANITAKDTDDKDTSDNGTVENDSTDDKDTSDNDTDTSDSSTTSDSEETSDTTKAPDDNPDTGIALSFAAVGVVGAAVVVSAKRRKSK